MSSAPQSPTRRRRSMPAAPAPGGLSDQPPDPSLPWSRLTDSLHYNLPEGLIWLGDRRVLTLGADWFGDLRRELIQQLGAAAARGLLSRLGHGAGCRDAQMALRLHGAGGIRDVIFAGVQFHALQGSVGVVPVSYDVDVEAGRCHLEFEWKNSVEVEVQVQTEPMAAGAPSGGGGGGDAGCWMELGYSSGFLSTCMGQPIVVRELSCRAAGALVCRCVAKPAAEWGLAGDDLARLQPVWPDAGPSGVAGALGAVGAVGTAGAAGATPQVIGRSASFVTLMHRIRRVATTQATVLLLGESGVGKSAFARELHRASHRAHQPLLEVNCAALPETLLEAELFGVEKGAFTGAQASRAGRFEEAAGGAIFLDEIGSLSLTAQGKLLRVLQTQHYERLGSSQLRQADVRIIAATNEDLERAVRDGRFRLDLFFRLNVVPITIPPLRQRRDDLPMLLSHLLRRFGALHGRSVPGFTARALRVLLSHDWPGNIRELENVIERGVILADDGAPLDLAQLFTVDITFAQAGLLSLRSDGDLGAPFDAAAGTASSAAADWALALLDAQHGGLFAVEDALVTAAVSRAGGNVAQAARSLKITRAQIDHRLKRLSVR